MSDHGVNGGVLASLAAISIAGPDARTHYRGTIKRRTAGASQSTILPFTRL